MPPVAYRVFAYLVTHDQVTAKAIASDCSMTHQSSMRVLHRLFGLGVVTKTWHRGCWFWRLVRIK